MWPFIGAVALFVVLGLLLLGERAFDRGRRSRKDQRRLASGERTAKRYDEADEDIVS